VSRARGVIETYDGAPAVDEALKVLAQSYHKLGVEDLAQVAENVRKSNALPDEFERSNAAKKDDDPWWHFWN
jgi:outer membrane protein assembly factor BamD